MEANSSKRILSQGAWLENSRLKVSLEGSKVGRYNLQQAPSLLGLHNTENQMAAAARRTVFARLGQEAFSKLEGEQRRLANLTTVEVQHGKT